MFYYLFDYLEREFALSGAGLFQFISFRAGAAIIVSLLISMLYGSDLIKFLQRKQIGESVRDLGLDGQIQKAGTPTMGGIMIITCIVIPTLLFAKLDNIYIFLLLVTSVWLGLIGFTDDYIKVFKKNKEGLQGRFKVVGQVGLGIFVGLILYFHDSVVVRQFENPATGEKTLTEVTEKFEDVKSTITTIPFFKSNEFDYSVLAGPFAEDFTWLIYVLIVTFIITAVSNGANITDGIDGLAAGTSAIIVIVLGVLAYVSGNTVFSDYLNVMYLPNSGELVIFCAAFAGACIGFLWYNSYPAQIFMGDTGSLSLGGTIAVLALTIRKELLIPILCGIFLIENISVILQVSYFKYTKKKYGEGRRIFKMAPLHHHYQKNGMHESKIVTRFLVVGGLLAVITLTTLKIR